MSRKFIIAIFLLLTLILGRVLVWPKYQELKLLLEQRNKEKRVEIERREAYLQDLKEAAQVLKNYEIQLAKIDSALPPNPGLEALLLFIQKASSQSGLVLTDIKSVSRTSSEEELKETELSFWLSGAYTSFKNFLSVLEKTSRLIEVESISFSSSEKEGLQKFDLKIKIYSY